MAKLFHSTSNVLNRDLRGQPMLIEQVDAVCTEPHTCRTPDELARGSGGLLSEAKSMAVDPYPYGGKTRQVMVNLNPRLMQAKGLSPNDVLTALGKEQLILPGGTAKIGQFEYDVDINADLKKISEFNDLPIKKVGNTIIYLRDVATVSDGLLNL
jgi:hypothetical protein